jgi:hypothetical protein
MESWAWHCRITSSACCRLVRPGDTLKLFGGGKGHAVLTELDEQEIPM